MIVLPVNFFFFFKKKKKKFKKKNFPVETGATWLVENVEAEKEQAEKTCRPRSGDLRPRSSSSRLQRAAGDLCWFWLCEVNALSRVREPPLNPRRAD